MCVTLLIVVGAVNAQNNLLFFLFGISLSAMLASGVVSGGMMMGVDVDRVGLRPARAGELVRLAYRVHNRNRFLPVLSIMVADKALSGRARSGKGFRFNRKIWMSAHAYVPFIGPRQSVVIEVAYPEEARGIIQLQDVVVSSSFPFGIFMKSVAHRCSASLLVRPRIISISREALSKARGAGRSIAEDRKRKGHGLEFYALREYAHSDSPRQVAWKASARAGTLLTKQHAAPMPRACIIYLVLDQNHDPHQQEHRISYAASLISELCATGQRVGLRVPAADIDIPAGFGDRAVGTMHDELARIDLARLRTNIRDSATSGRGEVITIDQGVDRN